MVLKDLAAANLLFEAPKFEHSYPHCWRCDTPLIYYARESWYIKETAVKDDLIRNNNTVNWIPESIGKGRFGNWLENIQDWAISRNRYWGTPLNIWECECGHRHCIGSREELVQISRWYVFLKCLTVGLTPVRCRLHSIIIRLKIRNCSSSSSRHSLFRRRLTRPEAGSIL